MVHAVVAASSGSVSLSSTNKLAQTASTLSRWPCRGRLVGQVDQVALLVVALDDSFCQFAHSRGVELLLGLRFQRAALAGDEQPVVAAERHGDGPLSRSTRAWSRAWPGG